MNDIIRIESDRPEPALPALPSAREAIRIRPGVLEDFAFIDDLQKRHKKQVGFMFKGAIEGHIEKGHVLVAEATPGSAGMSKGRMTNDEQARGEAVDSTFVDSSLDIAAQPVGYLIAVDRYLKRDELGIIYQMNIVPDYQRSLVAANLLKAQFDRSAYGCRLYCCWCAQDLAANHFWEAMGFVPLAFRTGGGRRKKDRPRMHIFWQKRIRQGDDYPYWFPSQTGAGAIGEDRLVLPIPPGSHWSEAKPIVLPEGPSEREETKLLEAKVSELEKARKGLRREACGLEGKARGSLAEKGKAKQVKSVAAGGLHFGPRKLTADEAEAQEAEDQAKAAKEEAARIEAELKEAKKAARKAKKKFDPAQAAFARELKDRWLEEVAAQPGLLAPSAARYDVSRQLPDRRSEQGGADEVLRLDAA